MILPSLIMNTPMPYSGTRVAVWFQVPPPITTGTPYWVSITFFRLSRVTCGCAFLIASTTTWMLE